MTSAPWVQDSAHNDPMYAALRVGEYLLAGGLSVARATSAVSACLTAFGVRGCTVDATFSAITISQQRWEDSDRTLTRLVKHRRQDFERLAQVEAVVVDVTAGRCDPAEAQTRLDSVKSGLRPFRSELVTLLVWAGMGAAVAFMLGGSPTAAAVAFSSGVLVQLAGSWLTARQVPPFFSQAAGGAIVTSIAGLSAAVGADVRPSLVIATGIVVLLSGMTFTAAVEDAITGFYITATARLAEVVVLTGGLVAGVGAGLSVLSSLGVQFPALTPLVAVPLHVKVPFAAVAAVAFAYASWAQKRTLWAVAALGACSVSVASFAGQALGPAAGAGAAATCVGLLAHVVAARLRIHSALLVAASVVPLVPGLMIYRGLFTLLENENLDGLLTLTTAAMTACAIAAGLVLGELVSSRVRRTLRQLEAGSRDLLLRATFWWRHGRHVG